MKKLLLLFILFVSYTQAQIVHVHWSMESKKISDCEYELIFKANIDKYYHIFSIIPSGDSRPTIFTFKPSADYALVGKMTEPAPHVYDDEIMGKLMEHHSGLKVFKQKIKLLSDKKVTIKGEFEYQECDTVACTFPPVEKFKFELQGSPSCVAGLEKPAEKGPDSLLIDTLSKLTAAPADTAAPAEIKPASYNDDAVDATSMSWLGIFLAGFLGGFAALLTPCVFPMIPMNVSFFTKQSKTKQQGIRNAFIYAIFLITLYVGLGLGVTLLFGAGALHTLSTNAWFNLAFFVLLVIFGISFLGAFEIVLPSSFVNKMDSKADRGGLIGIFFMAFTLALVSFSCTGPIIGTLLVEAAAGGGISGPFWGMFGFSLALALPFGLFAAFPGWLNSLPKSGGWLNSVKVVLGFLELALALKFASNADLVYELHILTREVFISLWIVIFALQSAYLLGMFKTSHDSDLKHVSVTRLFFAILSLFVTVYLIPGLWGAPLKLFSGVLPPVDYSESPYGFGGSQNNAANTSNTLKADPEFGKFMEVNKNGIVYFKNDYDNALAYAKKVGRPLMVDFTGHACANCRKTEDYVWPDPEIVKRLNNEVVLVSLYVDDKRELDPKDYMTVQWYGKEREITDIGDKFKYMEEKLYGQSTQPLYVLLDHKERLLINVRGYDPSIEDYIKWMDQGIASFKNKKQ
ncbi:MAG: thioredoxin family protein [Bacteroidia bacterium]|nr:thioredoxin family protein [Bacteroidia bacterium]